MKAQIQILKLTVFVRDTARVLVQSKKDLELLLSCKDVKLFKARKVKTWRTICGKTTWMPSVKNCALLIPAN